MSKLRGLISFIGHYKYLIVIVLGIIAVGFIGENSYLRRMQLEMQISDLKEEIKQYDKKNLEAQKRLEEIDSGKGNIEKIARENYFMKTDDEDIFVLSSDMEKKPVEKNETAK